MAFALVNTAQNATGSGTSLAVTVTSTTQNNLMVVNVKVGGESFTVSSVTDSAGNTYAKAVNQTTYGGAPFLMEQWYGVQITGGATTVTINLSGTTSARAQVDEFSGGATTNATVFDKAITNRGTGTSSSVTLSPTNSGELISAGVGFTGVSSITAGTNYTLSISNTNGAAEYRLSGTTSETAPMSWTTSSNWAESAGAYNPVAVVTANAFMTTNTGFWG